MGMIRSGARSGKEVPSRNDYVGSQGTLRFAQDDKPNQRMTEPNFSLRRKYELESNDSGN